MKKETKLKLHADVVKDQAEIYKIERAEEIKRQKAAKVRAAEEVEK